MNEPQEIRDEVIARLMIRHGLSYEQAASAWEEYKLHLLAAGMRQRKLGDTIDSN